MIYTRNYGSPIGNLLLAESEGQLIGLWLQGQKYYKGSLREEMQDREDSEILCQTGRWLDRYFAGEQPLISELNLAPRGSQFRQEVWKRLCEIPSGVAHNPISIIIPCHRVVGTQGSLTGYAGGIDKKIWLLQQEGVDLRHFYIPKKGTAL